MGKSNNNNSKNTHLICVLWSFVFQMSYDLLKLARQKKNIHFICTFNTCQKEKDRNQIFRQSVLGCVKGNRRGWSTSKLPCVCSGPQEAFHVLKCVCASVFWCGSVYFKHCSSTCVWRKEADLLEACCPLRIRQTYTHTFTQEDTDL